MVQETDRFIAVLDPAKASLNEVVNCLISMDILIVEQYPFLNTLIIRGDEDLILKLPTTTLGVKSVEREGTVRIPE